MAGTTVIIRRAVVRLGTEAHATKGYYVSRRSRMADEQTADIGCPRCGHRIHLDAYRIKGDGTVYPPVVCPLVTCQFMAFVALENWGT